MFVVEASRHQVFPLDDRVTERENPAVAGRLDLHHGRDIDPARPPRRPAHRGGRAQRQEPLAHHHRPARRARRGRRRAGGAGRPVRRVVAVRRRRRPTTPTTPTAATSPTSAAASADPRRGGTRSRCRFEYDGVTARQRRLRDADRRRRDVGSGEIPATTAYYFAFDETFNVGVDRGTPVTDDYPPVHNSVHRHHPLGALRPRPADRARSRGPPPHHRPHQRLRSRGPRCNAGLWTLDPRHTSCKASTSLGKPRPSRHSKPVVATRCAAALLQRPVVDPGDTSDASSAHVHPLVHS